MPIQFYCSECFGTLSIGSRKAGTRIFCPRCGGETVVPTESNLQRLPVTAAPGPRAEETSRAAAPVESIMTPPAGLPVAGGFATKGSPAAGAGIRIGLPACPPPAGPSGEPPVPALFVTPRRLIVALAVALLALGVCTGVLVALLREGSGPALAQAPQPGEKESAPAAAIPDGKPALPIAVPERVPPRKKVAAANPAAPREKSPVAQAAPQAPKVVKAQPPARNETGAEKILASEPRPAEDPPSPNPPGQPHPRKKLAGGVLERLQAFRRSRLTDQELRKQLLLAPEVSLNSVPGTTKNLLTASRRSARTGLDLVPLLTTRRADLVGLPVRTGQDSRLSKEEALNLQVLSQLLRRQLETSMPGNARGVIDLRPDPKILRDKLLNSPQRAAWLRPEAIPTLRQLTMHEHNNVRLILVEALENIPGPQASKALAERALFDLNADVRAAALAALKGRPVSEYEPALVAGFRYPFPAVADHAAEALVALDLVEAVPDLILLLDARDLNEPFPIAWGPKRVAVVPELVRVNHLRNCLLCHAPSFSATDPVRGLVPNVTQRLPLPASGAKGTSGSSGGAYGGGGGGTASGCGKKQILVSTFIRADITYLKQDFSVLQPVPNHGRLWPADQRYDYLVRLRPLTKKELSLWQDNLQGVRPVLPQQEALLSALRKLTGEDPGPSPEDWKRFYSPVTGRRREKPLEAGDQVAELVDGLVKAPPRRQAELLLLYKDRGGSAYTRAIALALPRLKAELQKTARVILADRMFCLPVKDLREQLQDRDQELRRAAARACGLRKEKALMPELIALLGDDSPEVVKQAHLVLRRLTSHDFGPSATTNPDKRREAMTAWREWWEKQDRKGAGQKRKES